MIWGLFIIDKIIVVPLNLFKLEQEIIVVDSDSSSTFAQVELSHLPEVLIEACKVHDINEIKIIGNGNYSEALSNEIKNYAIQNYSEKNIEISIIAEV